jgi:shikimate kinase
MNNVFLTGFMATGKTAVGRALGRRLARRFIDLDEEIERAAGLAVCEIFARFGEPEFRDRERQTLLSVCAIDGAVVATGGGTVLDARSRDAMHASGTIVCLTAAPEAILTRLGNGGDRPLLAGSSSRAERIASLLAERAAAYADADFTLDTSRKSVNDVARSIADWLSSPARAAKAPSEA